VPKERRRVGYKKRDLYRVDFLHVAIYRTYIAPTLRVVLEVFE
jgi:hypothetical protein